MGTTAFQSVGHERQQEEEGFPGRRCAECHPPQLWLLRPPSSIARLGSVYNEHYTHGCYHVWVHPYCYKLFFNEIKHVSNFLQGNTIYVLVLCEG